MTATQQAGSEGQIQLMRIDRLYVRRGQETELTGYLERSIQKLRERQATLHSHLARTYGEDGTCEIVLVLVGQPPIGESDLKTDAGLPFDPAGYADMVQAWTECTYELVQTALDDLARAPAPRPVDRVATQTPIR
jgi:hypothetical protein